MTQKIRVGVVFGGKSGEHEVSIKSAQSVIENLNCDLYEILPIGIDKSGTWHVGIGAYKALGAPVPTKLLGAAGQASDVENLLPIAQGAVLPSQAAAQIDVILPILHGPYGEDGTVQGLFELMNIPYVGAGVLASAVGMDKAMMKTVFAQAGLAQCRYEVVLRSRFEREPEVVADALAAQLGFPCFVKPANLGSSVGISKAKDRDSLIAALQIAAKYDRKIIVEEAVDGREIEVAVLGNEDPQASMPGEIISSNEEFYDYDAKYLSGESAMVIPAELTAEQIEEVRALAVRSFQAIDGSGLSRADFFLCRKTGKFLINEINTFPGFTQYSMYPKMWEASGLPYDQLIESLIHLAIERHEDKNSTR
ncbi:D-alanine--D-alanine ligase [Tumebacillus permanentifrigoris]|uniref:D-alanine--D-alanine ligase n=1 Tax=Tumebacillus permanentifrigoris TaxID=378543 RepID=A0A316DE80_9BACL|nr:D-alanine--D-alanine ligase [Tumebacillus permanentifrigoris]PWK16016.1 D-alanine--D-alanine ligase [Tumebacillus permanentifrigoris]